MQHSSTGGVKDIKGPGKFDGRGCIHFSADRFAIADTSEDVLAYWAESIEESVEKIGAYTKRIVSFLSSLRGIDSLAAVTLIVSEGYDTSYRDEKISLERLGDRFVQLAAEYDWSGFPSVMLTIPI